MQNLRLAKFFGVGLVAVALPLSVFAQTKDPSSSPAPYTSECQARLDVYMNDTNTFFSQFEGDCPVNPSYLDSVVGVMNLSDSAPGGEASAIDSMEKGRKIETLSAKVRSLKRQNRSMRRKLRNRCG